MGGFRQYLHNIILTRKLKDYYELSSAAAVVLQEYSERGGDHQVMKAAMKILVVYTPGASSSIL